uniref:Helicase SEN1 n=1 Tax=Aegilops tauschii TaxID=37682 RepID=M8BTR5_AEGTA
MAADAPRKDSGCRFDAHVVLVFNASRKIYRSKINQKRQFRKPNPQTGNPNPNPSSTTDLVLHAVVGGVDVLQVGVVAALILEHHGATMVAVDCATSGDKWERRGRRGKPRERVRCWAIMRDGAAVCRNSATRDFPTSDPGRQRLLTFSHCFDFLESLPKEEHIWCGYADIMGPFLEMFHGYFDEQENSLVRTIWSRISQELGICTQCVCEHHQAQESFDIECRSGSIDPLQKVLRHLDEERVTKHLEKINAMIQLKEYDPSCHGAEVVCIMFEVLMYPVLLDDQSLANQFQKFIETIDESYEVSLSTNQQYPGVYALLFFKSGKARAIGLRLSRSMGKLRKAVDLEPLQPLLQKYINFLDAEVLPSTPESSRPRVQLQRADVWLGFKSLLGFLEAPAFEDGILEKYPIFLNIVLNHVSDDGFDLSCAVSCLKASFEMLVDRIYNSAECGIMEFTASGDEVGGYATFVGKLTVYCIDVVLLNCALIALLIVQRGYTMNPPCPASECAHMWGPSLICSLNDTSLHSSLRQPAFDLINILIVSDASALISFKLKYESATKGDSSNSVMFVEDEDELPFADDTAEKEYSCWSDFRALNKLTFRGCKDWTCVPLLWYLVMVQLEPSKLPMAFSKAVFWALSHISILEPGLAMDLSVPVNDWLSSHAGEVSSTFSWQVPNGADDGGGGKDCINTLKVSKFGTLLLRIFKRFAIRVIMQIEQCGLQKQWTWEPMMAESLILALVDPNDNVRQAGRAVMEHVSQARGLTPGLQFLCSSASSLSAVFVGLRYAVQLGSFPLYSRPDLIVKLNMVERQSLLADFHSLHHLFFVICKLIKEDIAQQPSIPQPAKPSEGGFLRQPFSNVPITPPEHAVDIISWEKFSTLLSATLWPLISTCLIKGEELINTKQCQGSHGDTIQRYIEDLGDTISHDVIDMDELKGRISNLNLAVFKKVPTKSVETIPSLIRHTDQERHTGRDNLEAMKPSHASDTEHIILLSDSEENLPTDDVIGEEVLSSVKENDGFTSSDLLKNPSVQTMPVEDKHVSLKQQTRSDISASSRPVSTENRGTRAASKGLGGTKMPSVPANKNSTSLLPNKVKSSVSATTQPSRPNLSSDVCKFKSIFRDMSDDEDDPLEHALDNYRRPQIRVTKSAILIPKRQIVQLQLPAERRQSSGRPDTSFRRFSPPKLDSWFKNILEMDYFAIVGLSSSETVKKPALKQIPVCFDSQAQYVEIFQPLVIEEFKAQLQNAYVETPPEDMMCGSISILSVERVDEFLVVRGRAENTVCVKSKGCIENDLILLTKDPLKSSGQQVHVLGKVDRRESDKNKALIIVIKFYLSNEIPRLNKVKRLLVERSKWFLNRVLSMTPQLREFSALSSLNDIPVLPVILNPVSCTATNHESVKVYLDKLARPLRKVLKSSYNDSQLQAVSIAIGSASSKTKCDLSLIQGPPGTGKTKTIVAIVSALLSLHADNSYNLPRNESQASAEFTKPRTKISQTAAVARAWQDAALAKQQIKDSQRENPRTERLSKGILSRGRALICAQSNAAVDELVSRLSNGLYDTEGKLYRPYIVRVGNAKTVHPNSIPFFIDTLVEQRLSDELKINDESKISSDGESSGSLRARLEKVVDRIRYYESRRKLVEGDKTETGSSVPDEDEMDEVSDEAIGAKLNILYTQKRAVSSELATAHAREKKIADENKSLKHKVRKSILGEAEIVVTTLSGCGGDIYGVCSETASAKKYGNFSEQALFDVVVIDEAAQALEPATLIPLQLLKSKGTKCIMVGDPKQLPATVMSGLASKFLYECSMFERLQRAGYPVIMLTKQYRMHPDISRFPSLHFYENKLLDGAQKAEKSVPFHDHSCLGPYMFFDIADGRERAGTSAAAQSLSNQFEADAALEILSFLKNRYPADFSCRKIGIITPYRSQLSLLRSRFTSFFGPEIVAEMEINTVDGFQGREVDILVLSTVRASNSSGDRHHTGEARSIGFVADVRRMNVALTRARFSLWIVGNARTLQTNSHWASLLQNAKERNMLISVQKPYSLIFQNVHGTTHSHLKQQKENEKADMTNSRTVNAQLHKEHVRHADSATEKIGKSLREDQAKQASRWDQKTRKTRDSTLRKFSQENEATTQNDDMRATKGSLKQDIDQDSVMRKQGAEKKLSVQNVNQLELAKRLATGDPHDGSHVRKQRELNKPVSENADMETDKALFKHGPSENPKVRLHNYDKKAANQNNDMGTIKGSSKHDSVVKSVAKQDDGSSSAQHCEMQNLIQKAKGARKFSETPRFSNSNKEGSLLKDDAVSELANRNSGTGPPTIPDMKKNKVKGARKFTEQPRSGNSNQVDPSVSSHFDGTSSHIRDLTTSQAAKQTVTSQKDQIAARKRQREDVESLLSSALISSKKPKKKQK